MKKYNIVFFGTPQFSVPSLEVLYQHPQINICHVVSMPDRPSGRGKKLKSPEVIEFAKNNGIPFFQTENINKETDFLKNLSEIDFFVVIAFAQFLGSELLKTPRLGAFNIHTSLLPKYRGAAPIQYAILNGDTKTGVSIQKMVKKMDAGDLVYEHHVTINDKYTSATLFEKLQHEAALGLSNFLEILINDESKIVFRKQNENEVSFAPSINKADGLINPVTEDSKSIHNKTRAFFPWPGTFIFFNDFRVKVLETEKTNQFLGPGNLNTSMGTINIGCADGLAIRLLTVQLDGKKAVKDTELLNSLKNKNITLKLNRKYYE